MEPSQPPSKWWLRVLSAGVTQPVCESGHSHSSSANTENGWSFISTLNILYSITFKFTFTTSDDIKLHIYVYEPYMEPWSSQESSICCYPEPHVHTVFWDLLECYSPLFVINKRAVWRRLLTLRLPNIIFWHVYVLGPVYFVWPWKSRTPHVTSRTECNNDVTQGTLTATDTCIGYHVTRFEASRNVSLHTRYVRTCVGAVCGRGRELR
jgi:hypothetical protein